MSLLRLLSILILFNIFEQDIYAQQNCYEHLHSTLQDDSWLSCNTSINPNPNRGNSHWILYDLGFNYSITTSHFWNYNAIGQTNYGINSFYIDYSLDGNNWTNATTYQLSQAPGTTNYVGEAGPDLGGIQARYVLLTVISSHGAGNCAGLSEVQFNLGEQCTTTAAIVGLPSTTASSSPITLIGSPAGGTFNGNGVVFNAFNPALAGPGLHTVEYVFTDENNCTSSAIETILVFTITFTFVNYNLGIIAPKLINELLVEIEVPVKDRYTFQLTDALGRPIYSEELHYQPGKHQQNISINQQMSTGIYILTVTNSHGSVSEKLVHQP